MFRKLEMFDHHSVDEYGNVLNEKTGNILKPYVGSGGYLYVKPCESNKTMHLAIHRAVAMCFCKGYKPWLVVDHIDGNKENNYYKNLRWCEQADNLKFGYDRRGDSPLKYYKHCKLLVNDIVVDEFWCIKDAVEYAVEHYNVKASMLSKHKIYKNIRVEKCND